MHYTPYTILILPSQSVCASSDMPRDPKHNPVLGQATLSLQQPIAEVLAQIERVYTTKMRSAELDGFELSDPWRDLVQVLLIDCAINRLCC
jgi:hypothetical protein